MTHKIATSDLGNPVALVQLCHDDLAMLTRLLKPEPIWRQARDTFDAVIRRAIIEEMRINGDEE